MFGMLRPCRGRLGADLHREWMAHLCGLCLALRDEHGHSARLVTNVDAIVVSALVAAQLRNSGERRMAGPCALRGMRSASVAIGGGARLAAAASLLLASAKVTDHIDDGDLSGPLRVRAARVIADRWADAGTATATAMGLDAALIRAELGRQRLLERPGALLLEVTAPTEAATALVFRQAALVAGHPENVEPLAEAGRLFGRVAHLVDAAEDLWDDLASAAWNPIAASGATPDEVRRLCQDALLGIRLALADAAFVDDRLVHRLLVHEVHAAVRRALGPQGRSEPPPSYPGLPGPPAPPAWNQPPPAWNQPPPAGWNPPPPGWQQPPQRPKVGPWAGCLGWLAVCASCQVCCSDGYVDPCTGDRRQGCCRGCNGCDCSCCNCCDACDCCGCDC